MAKSDCDVDGCDEKVAQEFVLDGGHGATVKRCEAHSIPSTEWATSWVIKLPKQN